MSNYPPGVTGNEPAIAGLDEGTYDAPQCKGYMPEDSRAVPEAMIQEILAVQELIGSAGTLLDASKAQVRLERLRVNMLALPKAVDVECGWEGKVDAQFSGGRNAYTAYWTCPQCGSEQEEERERGDDHPDL